MGNREGSRGLAVVPPGPPSGGIEERISRWLEALLLGPGAPEAPVSISVVHAAVDQTQRLIRAFAVPVVPPEPKALAELVDAIATEIGTDAEDLGGMQRYQLKAQAKGKDIGSTTVRFAMDLIPSSIDSEPPNHRGLVAQSQRHTEAAFRLMLQGSGAAMQALERRLAAQEEMLERYHTRWLETLKLQEELTVRKAELEANLEERKEERELRMMKETNEEERKVATWQTVLGQLNQYMPVVAHYLTRGKFGKSAEQVLDEAEEGLAGMTEEQLAHARATMAPEQFAELNERVQAARAAQSSEPETGGGPAAATAPATPATHGVRPLSSEARLGAALHLRDNLLPLLVKRHKAGEPLFDPGADDWSLFALVRRLVASCTAPELEGILSMLAEPERAAITALAQLLKVAPAAPETASSASPNGDAERAAR